MKNYFLIFLVLLIACHQEKTKNQQDHSPNKVTSAATNEEKYSLIETIISTHGGYDILNFNYHHDDNYIQIIATSHNNEIKKFDYIEELFWWNNDSYFNDFLLTKIKSKLKETSNLSKKEEKHRAEPLKVEITNSRNNPSKC